jgi:hypothetical protein
LSLLSMLDFLELFYIWPLMIWNNPNCMENKRFTFTYIKLKAFINILNIEGFLKSGTLFSRV